MIAAEMRNAFGSGGRRERHAAAPQNVLGDGRIDVPIAAFKREQNNERQPRRDGRRDHSQTPMFFISDSRRASMTIRKHSVTDEY